MEKQGLRYVYIGLIVGAICMVAIYPSQTRLQHAIPERYVRKLQLLFESTSKGNGKGTLNLTDLGASPVYSALSDLDKKLQGQPDLPDIIELDYKPVLLTKGMNYVQQQDVIISLTLQRQVVCRDWEMYGLKTDGGWPVCKAKAMIPTQPCLVYSFGMGKVRAHEHIPGVFFYPVGLAAGKGRHPTKKWRLDTYKGILTHFKEENKTISYLKFDIDGMEWLVLYNMLDGDLLRNVMQLSFEIHVDNLDNVPKYFQLLKWLHDLGFRRWFYHHRLNGFPLQCDQSYINTNYKTISYLKFDIDGMEWIVLCNMLSGGLLRNVMQLSFEIHLLNLDNVPKYFQLLKWLHDLGFRRWFYHHRLNGFPLQCDQSYINMNYVK